MCANYTFKAQQSELQKAFEQLKIDGTAPFSEVKESIFPFTYASVIVAPAIAVAIPLRTQELVLTAKRYSLTPAWAKTPKVKWATYNARMNRPNDKTGNGLEYIYDVATWREPFAKYHCLVPMNEFKESCYEGEASGHIVKFVPKKTSLLFAAGIYSDWVDPPTGEILSTFAVITTEPDEYIKNVGHDRSPVFLTPDTGVTWLSAFKNGKEAYEFLAAEHSRPPLEYTVDRKLKTAL